MLALATVKTLWELSGNTASQDAALQSAIDAVEGHIEGYCSRLFRSRAVTETYPEIVDSVIRLKTYPVVSLDAVVIESVSQNVADFKLRKDLGTVKSLGPTLKEDMDITYTCGWIESELPQDMLDVFLQVLWERWQKIVKGQLQHSIATATPLSAITIFDGYSAVFDTKNVASDSRRIPNEFIMFGDVLDRWRTVWAFSIASA